jgi:hypothetical protein
MKKTAKPASHSEAPSADAIARMADRGQDISPYFAGKVRRMMPGEPILNAKPIRRVNVDLTASMLEELDNAAVELNISRQAVIKTLVRQALDQHYLATRDRRS